MKPIDSDHFQLSTGRTFYAHMGLIGLTPDQGSEVRVSAGYDDSVDVDGWTPAERIELADYMIALWQDFRAANQETKP